MRHSMAQSKACFEETIAGERLVAVSDADSNGEVNFDTPALEANRIMKHRMKKITDGIVSSGNPVRSIDEKGVYDKYPDGRKVYVKSTK